MPRQGQLSGHQLLWCWSLSKLSYSSVSSVLSWRIHLPKTAVLFLSVITPNMVWCLLIWYHVCWWLSKLYYPLVSLSLSWRIHYQPAWSIQCLLMPWQHRLSGHQLPLCWQLSKLSYSLVSLLPTWWIYDKPKWSTSCLLMIVKVVLLLSAIILELKNTLPTRIGNSVTADALGTQFSGHQWPLCWRLSKLYYSLLSLHPRW